MGQLETNLKNSYEKTLTRWQRLWRINAGMAWAGRVLGRTGGILKLGNASPFHGAPPGAPDMIGFDSIIITPEIVGRRVAVFAGAELKATKGDKLRKNQRDFKALIVKMGGIHREVREDGRIIESGFNV